jgi:mRNA-degrading endonuclease RelE of RelBE toxin-antitoxin system
METPYAVETTPTFERDLKALERTVAQRILRKIDWLAVHPELLSNPLQNMPPDLKGLQKYRIGDYRVLFWVDHSARLVTLYAVAHRSAIYKKL